jgi:hypothetical protein
MRHGRLLFPVSAIRTRARERRGLIDTCRFVAADKLAIQGLRCARLNLPYVKIARQLSWALSLREMPVRFTWSVKLSNDC